MVEFQSGEKGSLWFYYYIFPGKDPLKKSEEEGLAITLHLQKKKLSGENVKIMQINSMKGAFKYYRTI